MPVLARKPEQIGRTLSADVEEFIRGAIQRGDLKPGERLGSARQLAKQWKTSYGAVRQSLETLAAKGIVVRRPRAGTFVSSEPSGSAVNGNSRNIIGLLIPDIRMPEYATVTRHIQDAGHEADLEVLVSSTDNERERYDQSILRHLNAGVGGLVLVSPQQARISLETLLEIEKSGVPVVNHARAMDVVSWPTVMTDLYQAIYLPAKHLCDLGRKRIAFLSYSMPASHGTQIHYGLYRAAAESGLNANNVLTLTLPDEVYLNGWTDTYALRQTLDRWFDENKDVDAVCCMHDHIAAAVLTVLRDRGVRVPDDVAVTGNGGLFEMFGIAPGELTTIDTCIGTTAREIVRLLQLGRASEEYNQSLVIKIQPQLVVGRSTVPTGGPVSP